MIKNLAPINFHQWITIVTSSKQLLIEIKRPLFMAELQFNTWVFLKNKLKILVTGGNVYHLKEFQQSKSGYF